MNMRAGDCQDESAVAAAARSGQWSDELRSHIQACQACAEILLVAQALRRELPGSATVPLPAAGQVWWRAQIRARRQDAERAVQPVRLVQTIAALCAVIGAVLVLLRYAAQLQQSLTRFPSAAPDWAGPVAWMLLAAAAMFVAAVSAGLGFVRRASK
jgi:ABC-type Fe3+-siderophore transport system permease subunit